MNDSIKPHYDPILDKIRSLDQDSEGLVTYDPFLEQLRMKDKGAEIVVDALLTKVRKGTLLMQAPVLTNPDVSIADDIAIFICDIDIRGNASAVTIEWGITEEAFNNSISVGDITENGEITKEVAVSEFPVGETIYWRFKAVNLSGTTFLVGNGAVLNPFDALAPSGLTLTVLSDTSIKLDFTINSTNADGHKIERSLDGVTYTEVTGVLGAVATFTDTGLTEGTRYYYRVRAYKGAQYSAYCTAANDWTAIKMVLTSTDTGEGVSTMRLWFNTTDVVATLDGAGKWYSNSAGTADESASYTFTAGSLQTRYLKVTSGVSNMLVFAKGNWKQWGDLVYNPVTGALTTELNGFESSTNAATIAKDVSTLTTLEKLYIFGSNTLSGSVAALTDLTYLRVQGSNTLSGSVAALTNLTLLYVTGSNTLSGSVTSLTNLTYMYVFGSNTLSGSVAGLTSLTFLRVTGSNTLSGSVAALINLIYLNVTGSNTLSGSIAALTKLTYISVFGASTLSGDIGGSGTSALVNGIILINLANTNQMDTYTSGATWSLTLSSTINPAAGYGYSATEIDNMLIDMAASLDTVTAQTITLKGSSAARTSASDAAVTTLNGKGWSIVTN